MPRPADARSTAADGAFGDFARPGAFRVCRNLPSIALAAARKRGRATDRRRRTLGERAQLPIEPLQFCVAFGKKRREPVALADQLLHPAGAFFEA